MTDQQEREAKAAADKYFPDAPYMDCREHRAVFMAGFVAARATIPQGMRMVPVEDGWVHIAVPAKLKARIQVKAHDPEKAKQVAENVMRLLAAAPQQPTENQ